MTIKDLIFNIPEGRFIPLKVSSVSKREIAAFNPVTQILLAILLIVITVFLAILGFTAFKLVVQDKVEPMFFYIFIGLICFIYSFAIAKRVFALILMVFGDK